MLGPAVTDERNWDVNEDDEMRKKGLWEGLDRR